jgi:hypothetical protein
MDTVISERRLKGHGNDANGINQLEDGRICSCSNDEDVSLWSSRFVLCELTVVGHARCVGSIIQLLDGILRS